MKRRDCPGSNAIPPLCPLEYDQWCPICGREMQVGDNGCIVRHPMRYAEMVEHLADVVTSVERGWWEPIWEQPVMQ